MYAAVSFPWSIQMDFVRTSVDFHARCPCSENQCIKVASCRGGSPSGFQRSHCSWHVLCGEGSSLRIMSESGQGTKAGSLITKDSLSSRLWRKLSGRAGDGVFENIKEAVSGPSSITLGPENAEPDHLVVLVNGINGSDQNWEFAAKQFKQKLAGKVVVHCSATNSFRETFDGVDVMGDRLAHEVLKVIDNNRGVTKISFVGHSLGGLISRYAIGRLHARPGEQMLLKEASEASTTDSGAEGSGRDHNPAASISHEKATIAGLEPINFITLATPHLGCRDNGHFPFLIGLLPLEKVAPFVSHWFIGKTGKHLFLADGINDQRPLLERMVSDCEKEGRFLSALSCFEERIAYANAHSDRMVGWRTASIRKQAEIMPQLPHEAPDPKYPHIFLEEDVSGHKDVPAQDDQEEVMVTGLQKVPWRRVDVSFPKLKHRLAAHNLIQVKSPFWHSEGADVIDHIIDKHF